MANPPPLPTDADLNIVDPDEPPEPPIEWLEEAVRDSAAEEFVDGDRLAYGRPIPVARKPQRGGATLSLAALIMGVSAFAFCLLPTALDVVPRLLSPVQGIVYLLFGVCGVGGAVATLFVSAIARGRRGIERYIVVSRAFALGWMPVALVVAAYLSDSPLRSVIGMLVLAAILVPMGFILLSMLDAIFD